MSRYLDNFLGYNIKIAPKRVRYNRNRWSTKTNKQANITINGILGKNEQMKLRFYYKLSITI